MSTTVAGLMLWRGKLLNYSLVWSIVMNLSSMWVLLLLVEVEKALASVESKVGIVFSFNPCEKLS